MFYKECILTYNLISMYELQIDGSESKNLWLAQH